MTLAIGGVFKETDVGVSYFVSIFVFHVPRRPSVTLDQRPKAPHQLRQKIADKLFEALKTGGVSEMDALVQTLVSEQR